MNIIGIVLQSGAISQSDLMAQRDPHGYIMSLTAVAVVFSALIILFICYSITGNIMSGKWKFKLPKRAPKKAAERRGTSSVKEEEVAVAIAMALEKEFGNEVQAAIGMALHRYFTESIHDNESFVITIKPAASKWAERQSTFRKLPR